MVTYDRLAIGHFLHLLKKWRTGIYDIIGYFLHCQCTVLLSRFDIDRKCLLGNRGGRPDLQGGSCGDQ